MNARLGRYDAPGPGVGPLLLPAFLASLAGRRPQEERETARWLLRERILKAIEREPGLAPSRIVLSMGIGWSTLYYHLKALQARGLVHIASAGRHTFLYPSWMAGDLSLSVQRSVLQGGRARAVAEEVARRPGHDVASLAHELGISPRVVYHHVRRLVDAGLVESTLPRRYRELTASPTLHTLLDQERRGGPG